jgi:hypothetical protein
MTRRLLIPAFACLVVGMTGCSRSNRDSVQLSALCFPPTPDTNGLCAFSSGTCSQVLANGHLFVDLAVSPGGTLEYPIQIDNLRVDNSDTTAGRTNSNTAFVEQFDMRYVATGLNVPAASVNAAHTVPTSGSTVAVVTLIPSSVAAALSPVLPAGGAEMLIDVKARGHYADGTEFDTAEFPVPVTITQGDPRILAEFTCPTGTTSQSCPQIGQTAVTTKCQ